MTFLESLGRMADQRLILVAAGVMLMVLVAVLGLVRWCFRAGRRDQRRPEARGLGWQYHQFLTGVPQNGKSARPPRLPHERF
jgi:hypothetical protein